MMWASCLRSPVEGGLLRVQWVEQSVIPLSGCPQLLPHISPVTLDVLSGHSHAGLWTPFYLVFRHGWLCVFDKIHAKAHCGGS